MLESLDLPLGVVLGTFGVERSRITWRARPRTPARRRWTSAATRSPARRSSRSRSARSPRRSATAPSARRAASSAGRASSPRSSRRPSSCSTSATSTPRSWRAMLAAGAGGRRALRRRGEHRGRVGADLEIEPILFDPELIELRDEAIREIARQSHRLPVGPAARRRRGRARGRPDGDAVRAEPARPLAHEARGHEGASTSSSRSQALDRLAAKTLERFSV